MGRPGGEFLRDEEMGVVSVRGGLRHAGMHDATAHASAVFGKGRTPDRQCWNGGVIQLVDP